MSVEELNIHPPDKDVIAYLEDLLAQAKTGEIQAIAVVIAKGGYCTANGWSGVEKNCMSLIGEIETMKMDIMRSFVEQRVEYI